MKKKIRKQPLNEAISWCPFHYFRNDRLKIFSCVIHELYTAPTEVFGETLASIDDR